MPGGITLEDVRRVVTEVVAPMAVKVDTLTADRVTRGDMTALRNEVMDWRRADEARFAPRDVSEARYGTIKEDMTTLGQRLDAIEKTHEQDMRTSSTRALDGWRQIAYVGLGGAIALLSSILQHFLFH